MLQKIFLPTIFLTLAYGFWLSPDFKEISAGVAIFLFGMLSLEEGFRSFTGGLLERILKRATSNLWKSLGFGVLSTTLMQSSSLVSVITISFLSAGLITLAAGVGIIFGANLGTTTGAWLVAGLGLKVKISAYAMPMLVFGVILVFQKSKALKGIGYILSGLGFLFLGIHHMKEGFEAFKDTIDLAQFAVTGVQGLLLFTGIGVFATVVMQSSHATLVLIITALAASQITYENALALAIGANIGTTITAIIGSLSANAQGKRLALAHLIFNAITGLIAILFMQQMVVAVEWASGQVGIAQDDYTLKLAVFHSLFNLVGILVMLPFTSRLVRFLEHAIHFVRVEVDRPKHLTDSAAEFPDTAVRAVRQETEHVFDNAHGIIIHTLGFRRNEVEGDADLLALAGAQKHLSKLDVDAAYARSIKSLYGAIITFISRVSFSWDQEQSGALHHLRVANQQLVESIKDVKHLQKNLLHYINGSNLPMRRAYDRLRVEIVEIIRGLQRLQASEDLDGTLLDLDAIKVELRDKKHEFNDTLGELIRSERISPEMASSLMNDTAYFYDIGSGLINAAESLLVSPDPETTKSARSMTLDEDQLSELVG
ncbi:MAG: Na/Pi symporter [Gammaproteobacteria bacterium SHHR-1]|uniref:Na/Pi cotransporter family protein n=1 Tax=Magnetovirga frankeli TaxID=947516 RepID=UPI001293BE6A|nr:Na/Pi cotransporter family protein [gamma proteobacterium SS-5]